LARTARAGRPVALKFSGGGNVELQMPGMILTMDFIGLLRENEQPRLLSGIAFEGSRRASRGN
jgi:hypothetical protein